MKRAIIVLGGLVIGLSFNARAAPVSTDREGAARLAGWSDATLEAELEQTAPGRHLLVVVSAAWCGPCNQLGAEVLDTEAATRALAGDRGLRLDFDGPEGEAATARFSVINLPTTLVVDHQGRELGRVEGYDGVEAWLEAVADVRAGRGGLEALRAKAADGAPESALALAKAELFAGETERAKARLARLWADPAAGVAAAAARTWGRHLLRVRRDAKGAMVFFDEMSAHFAASAKDVAHFRYWAASAQHAAGDPAAAEARFARWMAEAPEDPRPVELRASFLVHFGYPRPACEAAISRSNESHL